MEKTVFDFTVAGAHGEATSLSTYRGQVLLIVNTASQCGFTPQYEGLEALFQKYRDQGFTILGFPCNQFRGQEPGTNAEIQQFCQLNFGVSFPVLGKVDVNGDKADPLFVFLKNKRPGFLGSKAIKWNFTKFLVDRTGQPVSRYGSTTKPEQLEGAIRDLL